MKKYSSDINNMSPWLYVDATGKTSVIPQKLYLQLKDQLPLKITDKDNYYIFDGKKYNRLSQREFKSLIKEYLPVEIRKRKDWLSVFDEFATDSIDISESDFDSDENIVAFENGVLHLDTMELKPFSDKYYITRVVPCKYVPKKTLNDAPIFKSYLTKLVGHDKEAGTFLMEYIGGVISNIYGYRFKRLLILVGKGNTGKSQYRELLINLVGESNCTSIDLRKLQERFGTSQLYGKRFAGSGDMSNMDISELNIAKELTGGDEISAEFKGKDSFTFKYRGFLGFNANDLPFFRGDRGSHVYERFNIVRCDNVIPKEERDPNLLEKMLKEKDVIASVSVRYLKDAIERGYKFTESQSMLDERKKYETNNNSLLAFYNDCCEATGKIRRSEFNSIYKKWCMGNNVKPERDREIPAQLMEHYGIKAKKVNGIFYYVFLTIKEEVLNEYDPMRNLQAQFTKISDVKLFFEDSE